MTMTFKGLEALGKAVRQTSPIDSRMPVEMQVALLQLALTAQSEPHSAAPGLSVDQKKQEMTEHADEDGKQAKEARLAC